jgi:hypothetical protein
LRPTRSPHSNLFRWDSQARVCPTMLSRHTRKR